MPTFITSTGLRLAYCREGSGPLLVCHPGGPGLPAALLGTLGGLDRSLTLLLLDPRGAGASERPSDGAYSLNDYVADLDELRAQLGLERFSLLGHSHGGIVAIAYASTYPDRVERLVLVGALAHIGEEEAAATRESLLARAGEPWYEQALAAWQADARGEPPDTAVGATGRWPFYFARYGAREAAHARRLHAATLEREPWRVFAGELATLDLRPALASIRAPTLVLAGGRDCVAGPVCADVLAGAIPSAQRVVIERCGHFPFVEQPGRFREHVTRFLARDPYGR